MLRERLRAILLFSAVIAPVTTFASAAANAESFDKPLQTKVVDLGPSPYVRPTQHIKLTCSYYPDFMVKQLDDPGNKGALFIATAPTGQGHVPPCIRRHGPGEIVIKAPRGEYHWDGYFGGVKRNLIFLYASDGGIDGGIHFAALDHKTMTKVFEDSVMLREGGTDDLSFVHTSDTQITLRYTRVVMGDCSVPAIGSTCWSKLAIKAGLKNAPMPKCSDYPGREAGKAESVIAYPVEVSLFPKTSMRALANPMKCWPSE
jgi:hypothetical protein